MTQTISLNAVPRPAGGFFFEDYTVGRRFHHVVPRTLTAGDASTYIALTGARNPVHCCLPLARQLGHEAMPLDDFLVFNAAFGKTVNDISYNAIANLGYADVRFMAPVYAGDTITCESMVIGTKENSNGIATRYHAQLVSGRATWQFAPKWDVGLAASGLFGEPGNAKQYGLGLEVGYLVTTNLWLSAGYNVLGYRDDDLATGESTQKGAYVRLRYKFDEAVFGTAGEASK